jgi:hypothetical protein
MIQYTITAQSVVALSDGANYTIARGSYNFKALCSALLDEDWDKAKGCLNLASAISQWSHGKFTVREKDGAPAIFFGDLEVHSAVGTRILEAIKEEADSMPLLRFWARLQLNPSYRSVQTLYTFLVKTNIPIRSDGHLLAYKSVREDWFDHYSGTIENRPGAEIKMPRNQVSDDPDVACGQGLHLGSLTYAQGFHSGSSRILVCAVDPQDVICIPKDAQQGKMRCCRYVVLGLMGSPLPDVLSMRDDTDLGLRDREAPVDSLEPSEGPLADIHAMSLADLRKYAATLHIVGASKIPGGKAALLVRILEERNKTR